MQTSRLNSLKCHHNLVQSTEQWIIFLLLISGKLVSNSFVSEIADLVLNLMEIFLKRKSSVCAFSSYAKFGCTCHWEKHLHHSPLGPHSEK